MPEACASAVDRLAARAVAVVCALALLAGAAVTSSSAVAGTELGERISSGRRSQAYFESVMLAQDAAVARINAQTKVTKRALKHANRAIKQRKHALWVARGVVAEGARRLAELEALQAQTPIEQLPPDLADRVTGLRQELDRAASRRVAIGKALRTSIRQRVARQHRLGALKRQERAAVARREAAEGGLGAYIVELTRLAQDRAEIQSSMRLSTVTGFTWPSVGRIAQTYGCTGFRLNPRRGSCAHFHDGLDIVAGYGSRVATAADGVVAYAGWNPWDEKGRAWLMVVSHPDGYVTRYGHLLPSQIVRVGEFVTQGQAIARMGNTGRSTGTHLHFELLQAGDTVDPWAYLPEGMVTVKVPRSGRDKERGRQRDARRGGHDRQDGPRWHAVARPGRAGDDRQRADRVDRRGLVDRAGATVDAERDVLQSAPPVAPGDGAVAFEPDRVTRPIALEPTLVAEAALAAPEASSSAAGVLAADVDPCAAVPCDSLREGPSRRPGRGQGPSGEPAGQVEVSTAPAGPDVTFQGVAQAQRGTSPVPS